MQSAHETLAERPISATPPIASAIKSILFVVHEDEGLESRLQAALSVARACSAHLQLLQVVPVEAYTVVDTYGGTFVSGELVQALEDEAGNVRTRLEDQLHKEDVSWGYEVTTSPVLAELLRSAAFADLMVIGRLPRWHEFTRTGPGLLGALICSSSTPLCIPGDGKENMDPFGNAVIAWNGSIEAANAVRGSIGLLQLARDVRIVRFTEEKQVAFPDTRLLEYLSRHDIAAVLDERVARTNLVDDLIEYAGVFAADYMVMGAYSHSRAGEFFFGGVTRELLGRSPISLVMTQ